MQTIPRLPGLLSGSCIDYPDTARMGALPGSHSSDQMNPGFATFGIRLRACRASARALRIAYWLAGVPVAFC